MTEEESQNNDGQSNGQVAQGKGSSEAANMDVDTHDIEQQNQAESSTSAGRSKTIHTFFGSSRPVNEVANGAAKSAAAASGPKRKKRKDDTDQARIDLNSTEGWKLGKSVGTGEAGPSVPSQGPQKKTRGRKSANEGEDAELREMAQRAKKSKGKQKKEVDANIQGVVDSSYIGPATTPPPHTPSTTSQPTSASPGKRKRGRPRKSPRKKASPTSPEDILSKAVNLVSSDPVDIPGGSTSPNVPIKAEKNPALRRIPLSRTASAVSTSSKGARTDPIDVEKDLPKKAGPKKVVFAADQKPTHSFFARKPEPAPPKSDVSRVEPEASELKNDKEEYAEPDAKALNGISNGKQTSNKPNGVHSFFNRGANKPGVPGHVRDGWGGKEGISAPWPGNFLPSHDAGPSTWNTSSLDNCSLPRKKGSRGHRRIPSRSDFWTSLTLDTPSSKSYDTHSSHIDSSIPSSHPSVSHPAIESIPHRKSRSNREAWTELYAPHTAAEVLGNETESTYLRDWLSALSVGSQHGVKRKIFRRVKRSRAPTDGWIVDDIGLFGDTIDSENEEEYEDFYEPPLELGERPESYPSLDDRLANCILLTGGHGVGKSAAVYAVAKELGWEVFEVHPGMGRRTGSSLMSWVGDVGKNHLVAQTHEQSPHKKKGIIGSFFGKSKAQKGEDGEVEEEAELPCSQGSAAEPIEVNDSPRSRRESIRDTSIENGTPVKPTMQGTNVEGAFRQSLILVDEADILFSEENTFWPTLIALIAESRRPVIFTCNEPSRIPIHSLPLQAILYFQAPSQDLGIGYLEAIATHNGIAKPGYVTKLYDQCAFCNSPLSADQPVPPNGHEPIPMFDLRKAICQIQLDRAARQPNTHSTVGDIEPDKLELLVSSLDDRSYVDANVSPRPAHILEMSEIDRYQQRPYKGLPDQEEHAKDAELGVRILSKPNPKDESSVLLEYTKSEEISNAISPPTQQDLAMISNLSTARIQYIRSLLPFLDPLIPLTSHLLPRSSLFLDVIPLIQSIVDADDILQAEDYDAIQRGDDRLDRKTGRPKRTARPDGGGYKRWIDLDDKALKAVRQSAMRDY